MRNPNPNPKPNPKPNPNPNPKPNPNPGETSYLHLAATETAFSHYRPLLLAGIVLWLAGSLYTAGGALQQEEQLWPNPQLSPTHPQHISNSIVQY